MSKYNIYCFLLFFVLNTVTQSVMAQGALKGVAQTSNPTFQGQATNTEKVDTRNHAIMPQWRGKRALGGITFDNDFDGARLNGITQDNDTSYTASLRLKITLSIPARGMLSK